MGRLLRMVFANDRLMVANNLVSGSAISNESESNITFVGNSIKDATKAFVDPVHGNLHLANAVGGIVDRVTSLPDVTRDIDGQSRGARPHVGADEPADDISDLGPGADQGAIIRDPALTMCLPWRWRAPPGV